MSEKNEAPAEPRRCSWGFHKWTVWGDPKAYNVRYASLGGKYESAPSVEQFQTRTCLLCNRKEGRVVR